jgi:hypothetical protein
MLEAGCYLYALKWRKTIRVRQWNLATSLLTDAVISSNSCVCCQCGCDIMVCSSNTVQVKSMSGLTA